MAIRRLPNKKYYTINFINCKTFLLSFPFLHRFIVAFWKLSSPIWNILEKQSRMDWLFAPSGSRNRRSEGLCPALLAVLGGEDAGVLAKGFGELFRGLPAHLPGDFGKIGV